MPKDRGALEKLQLALAGIDAALTVMDTLPLTPEAKKAVQTAKDYSEEARDHLLTVRFHVSLLWP